MICRGRIWEHGTGGRNIILNDDIGSKRAAAARARNENHETLPPPVMYVCWRVANSNVGEGGFVNLKWEIVPSPRSLFFLSLSLSHRYLCLHGLFLTAGCDLIFENEFDFIRSAGLTSARESFLKMGFMDPGG